MSSFHRSGLCLTLVGCLAAAVQAALTPQEIALIVAKGSNDSLRLAQYYCKVRGVPSENICQVTMPAGEECPRAAWESSIRPAVKAWLQKQDPQRKLRCLATTWDVPLKIGAGEPDEVQLGYKRFLSGELEVRLANLRRAEQTFRDWSDATKLVEAPADAGGGQDLAALEKKLERALQSAQAEIREIADKERQKERQLQVQQLAGAIGGANILLQAINQQIQAGEVPPQLKDEFHSLRGRNIGLAEIQGLLEQQAPSIDRDAVRLAILDRAAGWLGSAKWLQEQLATVAKNETGASFDSELALVLWPDGYQTLRWQPNFLNNGFEGSQLRSVYPTLMVARLDAPTLALAKGLIDTAIEVEKTGLKGKAYFDARGIGKRDQQNVAPGSYADYDRALLATADGMRDKFKMEVVLDEQPALFAEKSCPDAALYCGWYSLAKYVDAFDWAPGAVAYHLASSEASTLHDPKSQVWCKRMLEDGVCATIGPVYEPYLVTFPRPNEFFALLLQGRHTLVECYALTNPTNSWMMTLIGDPLYRPFIPKTAPGQRGSEQ